MVLSFVIINVNVQKSRSRVRHFVYTNLALKSKLNFKLKAGRFRLFFPDDRQSQPPPSNSFFVVVAVNRLNDSFRLTTVLQSTIIL